MLAALASAAMPDTSMAGVCEHNRSDKADNDAGIDYAVVQDTAGRQYDVFVSSEPKGKKLLAGRAKAAKVLAKSHEMSGLGFAVDRALAFSSAGTGSKTGKNSVLVSPHIEGEPRQLDLLTLQDAASVGTAIGAIHRQRTDFLTVAKYPAFTTGQIRAQLTGWIKRLQQAGHVPPAITSSWAKIIETDGLWSFSTTLTHGGFEDGDFLFAGSTITKVGNWQDMQVNDPARDLAWMFAKMDEDHRNALMNAYGGMMGSRIDDLILLRANLWLQMEQVGDFIEALGRADNTKILQFKAQVEHLAHQLTVVANKAAGAATAASAVVPPKDDKTSSRPTRSSSRRTDEQEDEESDKTGSAEVTKLVEASDSTADRPVHFKPSGAYALDEEDDDRTDDTQKPAMEAKPLYPNMPNPSSSATMILAEAKKNFGPDDDDTDADDIAKRNEAENLPEAQAQDNQDETGKAKVSWHVQYSREDETYSGAAKKDKIDHDAPTALIPLLEQEQRALHDAQMGLEEAEEKAEKERSASRTDMKAQDDQGDEDASESEIVKELDDAAAQDDADKSDDAVAEAISSSDEISTDSDDSDDSDDTDDPDDSHDSDSSAHPKDLGDAKSTNKSDEPRSSSD
ncbi:aminoglycoside phosphotransferase [Bifidobacterium sp. ESL0728]|uniref:phosphotransferase n=1 Tax=Bifidobacterium sp. ESL0728 TaxID=2983220 RepID=UPI0023F74307|nr:phosphotransferase [Bifidobacterium sp. ESL0728]WEV58596.1 aminoglycoside phosphotransferase [Bifidobacterium sp. ESL0728]